MLPILIRNKDLLLPFLLFLLINFYVDFDNFPDTEDGENHTGTFTSLRYSEEEAGADTQDETPTPSPASSPTLAEQPDTLQTPDWERGARGKKLSIPLRLSDLMATHHNHIVYI